MTKKTYTAIFTVVATILNIILTALIMGVLLFISTFFYFKVLGKTQPGISLALIWMFCFLAGFILGIFSFSKLCGLVIEKWNLASKLDPKVLGRFLPNGTKNPHYQEPTKIKTNIPKSDLDVESDQWANDIATGVSASEDLSGANEDLGNLDNDS